MDQTTKPIGSQRAVILDLLDAARSIPAFPVERWFDMNSLVAARKQAASRVSWVTLFAKAYSLAALQVPELRQFYLSFPWPRVYQSRYTVISVSVNRQVEQQDRLFFARLLFPEERTLTDVQDDLDGYIHGDVYQKFRQQLLCSRVPRFMRRLGWWWRNNIEVRQRARRFGTGGISVLAGQGVYNRLHPSPLTSSLSYGPLDERGQMWVTLQCDHRVMDGAVAARALNLIDHKLQTEVLSELRGLTPAGRPRHLANRQPRSGDSRVA